MIFFVLFLPIFLKNSLAAEDVQHDTSEVLTALENLNSNIVYLTKKANHINASLPKLTSEISEALQMNPLVLLKKETLDKGVKKGKPVNECQKILHEKSVWVGDKLYELVSDRISKRLKEIQNELQSIEKQTNDFINKVKSDSTSPKTIEEIIHRSDEDFLKTERIRHILKTLVKNTLYDLDEEPTSNVVKVDLLKPLHECLEHSNIAE